MCGLRCWDKIKFRYRASHHERGLLCSPAKSRPKRARPWLLTLLRGSLHHASSQVFSDLISRHSGAWTPSPRLRNLLLNSLVLAYAANNCIRAESSDLSYAKTIAVNVDSTTGEITLRWRDGSELHGLTSNVTLTEGRLLTTDTYTRHRVISGTHEITIEHTKLGMSTLIQRVYIPAGKPWVEIQAELDSSTIPVATNRFVAFQIVH
jgi:hypothetical protein